MGDILEVCPIRFAVCSYVSEREARYVFDGVDFDGQKLITPINLAPLIANGKVELVQPDMRVLANRVVVFAHQGIQNGEAITGALADQNGWAIGSDDIRAREQFSSLVPHLQVISTYELLKRWAEEIGASDATIGVAIRKIAERGRFEPSERLPLFEWAQLLGKRSNGPLV